MSHFPCVELDARAIFPSLDAHGLQSADPRRRWARHSISFSLPLAALHATLASEAAYPRLALSDLVGRQVLHMATCNNLRYPGLPSATGSGEASRNFWKFLV